MNPKTLLTAIPLAYVAFAAYMFHSGLRTWGLLLVTFSIVLALLVIVVNAPTRK